MITNAETAKKSLTPKLCFVNNEQRRVRAVDLRSLNVQESADVTKEAGALWDKMDAEERAVWELQSRTMIAQQPSIAGRIVDALIKDPTLSWEQLATETNNWCSAATIRRFVTSHPSYCTYAERLLPLLSPEQMRKHVTFSTSVRNNWGQALGKFLWIHYDEK